MVADSFAYAPSSRSARPAEPKHGDLRLLRVPLDQSGSLGGMGRSLTFPMRQWQARDEHGTVFFDEGKGHPIVFVHGLGANATHWEHLATRLVGGYRVVGLDLVGLGWSHKPRQRYTVELLRDHLLSFMRCRGIGQATLIGHSLGGTVALEAALRQPDRFRSLVLIGAACVAPLPAWMRVAARGFFWSQEPAGARDGRRVGAQRREKVKRSAAVRTASRLLLPTLTRGADWILDQVFYEDSDASRAFRESALRDDPGLPNLRDFVRVCGTLCPDLARRNYSDQLGSLQMPVLSLWGDGDKLTDLSATIRALNNVPQVRTAIIPRCGHMPMIEHPEECAFHIERFIRTPPKI